jgi:chitodextrinase
MFRVGHKIMVLFVTGLALSLGALNSASAATKGSAPRNFRLVAKTAYTVTLAWDAPTGMSGDFNYYLWGAYNVGPTVVLPKTATSYTFKALYPGNTYTFGIYAKDSRGNVSAQANLSGIRLPSDTTPPTTAPIVSIDEVGANYATVSWMPAQDDGPHLSTQIYLNGVFWGGVGRGVTNLTLRFLQPATSYSLSARAIDFGYNVGPLSDPITLTTAPANPNDVTPPSIPSVYAFSFGDGSTEMQINWSQSTDDFDAQKHIRYDVYVNGVLNEVFFGSSGPSIAYGEFGDNIIEVFASDTAGNTSEPGVAFLTIP